MPKTNLKNSSSKTQKFEKSSASEAIARDLIDLEKGTDNIYETIVILTKRANQLASEEKEELGGRLSEFAPAIDSLEETFENREQIELSLSYEKKPKVTLRAIDEYLKGKVYFRKVEDSVE
ncbi:MAG: DNA-directed RNA polymerase subunit omega [Bacteroidetes bacterium]|jgi:DNA-directed RNA polymerase subunit K/omega|nr:DNA-directed RNA polymerase subunit omega [Bacteroidota bacterium]